jgi:hypothetical protein
MIKISVDFHQFSGEKLSIRWKTNVMAIFNPKTAVQLESKSPI